MLLKDVFRVTVLSHHPPYYVVKHGNDVFTVLEEAMGFPFIPGEDPDEQWLDWLVEFSVSIQGTTSGLFQSSVDRLPGQF